jgi:isoleucyl-tRNA synthetase
VVAKLQLYCSEDLGGFYLDVLKDRLYTTAPKSLARRSAQTALYQITHAMLRWMAPFLSFTAEEAWGFMGQFGSTQRIHLHGNLHRLAASVVNADGTPNADRGAADQVATHLRDPRPGEQGNRGRAHHGRGGLLAASQRDADVPSEDHALLASLGDDLKFVFITSAIELIAGSAIQISVEASKAKNANAAGTTVTTWATTPPTPVCAGAAPATCTARANSARWPEHGHAQRQIRELGQTRHRPRPCRR